MASPFLTGIYRIYETLKKRKETAAQQKKLLVLKRKYYFLREIFFYFSFRNFAYYQEKYSAIFLFIASALFRFYQRLDSSLLRKTSVMI